MRIVAWQVINSRISLLFQAKCSLGLGDDPGVVVIAVVGVDENAVELPEVVERRGVHLQVVLTS